MKRAVLCAVILAGSGTALTQAVEPMLAQRRLIELDKVQLEGKLRAAVEIRTTTGAPYSAEATTEFEQILVDGNRIVRKSMVRVYRDSEGRVRREHVAGDGSTIESVTIVDPAAETSVILDPDTRTAFGEARGTVVLPDGSRPAPALDAERKKALETELRSRAALSSVVVAKVRATRPSELVTRQDLGQRTIEGLNAYGIRTTTTIPAGAIGNEQPIRIVSDEWFSPELKVLVLTRHSDPRSGETTYTLSNINRAEPSPSLFEVPADYTRK